MKTITKAIRLCLASIVLTMASTQLHAQIPQIYGRTQADCGQIVEYSTSVNELSVREYYWSFGYSDGTFETYFSPKVSVRMPDARGTLTISCRITYRSLGQTTLFLDTDYGNPPIAP